MLLNILSAYAYMYIHFKCYRRLVKNPLYVYQNVIGVIIFSRFSANEILVLLCRANGFLQLQQMGRIYRLSSLHRGGVALCMLVLLCCRRWGKDREVPCQELSLGVNPWCQPTVSEVGAIPTPVCSCDKSTGCCCSIDESISSYSSMFVLSKILSSSWLSSMINMLRSIKYIIR